MADGLPEHKKPWSKPLTMIAGLAIVGILIAVIFFPGLLNLKMGSETGGKVYEKGSGIGGFLKGIEPSYTIVYGNTLDSEQQVAAIGFSGKYGITESKMLAETSGNENNAIIVVNSGDSGIQEPAKSWSNSQESALVIVDEEKSTLTVIGSTKQAVSYAINFLKNNQLCEKLKNIVVVIPINSNCNENIYAPMASVIIESTPQSNIDFNGESGRTLFSRTVKTGTYSILLNEPGYNSATDTVVVSLADQINQKQITKTYTLVPVSGQLLVQANKEGVAITIGSETKAVDAVGTARFTLSPGTYSVKATLKNYADKSASVNIEAGKEASTRFEFIDTDIACTPAWSTGEWGVCINKIKTRTITKSNDCPLNINKPIEAEQCCLEAWTCTEWSACPADASGAKSKRTCTVLTGCEQSQEPQSQTEKDCPAPTQGMLKLSLEPAGAGVFIDGVSKSGTEFTLSAGTYKISASFAGYDDISETATIIAGQTLSKEYILQPFVSKTFDDIKNNKNAEGFAIVIGSTAALSDNIGGSDIAGKLGVSEAAVDLKTDAKNMILVGGPCVNTKVAELAAAGKFPYTCSNWPGEDFVIFKTVKQKGNNYLIVAGTTAEDTRRGGRVVAKLDDYKTALKKKEARFYGKAGNINDVSEVSTVSQQPQEPQQPVCAEGGLRCQGTNLEICSANAWNLKQACANGCDAFTLECKQAVAAEPLQLSGFTWTGVPKKNIPITFTPVASGGTGAYAYSWTITDDDTGVVEAEYSVEKPAHTFLTTDFYIVKLTVTDSLGQAKTISKDINPAPAPA